MTENSSSEIIIKLTINSWRFAKLFKKVIENQDAGKKDRYSNQINYFFKTLEESLNEIGMNIVNLEGKIYEAGMAVIPLNIEDFNPEAELLIDEMLEPVIMNEDGVFKNGTVILREVKR